LIRNGTLPAIGGSGSGVCAAYVVLREHMDEYLDGLGEQAVERAEQRLKTQLEKREVGERRVRYPSIAPRSGKSATIIALESPHLYLTIEEAAQYLRVSRRTVYTLMEKKQLTYTRVREGLRFRLQWLNEYLNKRTVVGS
jgi:excisionase family DNA binding protein